MDERGKTPRAGRRRTTRTSDADLAHARVELAARVADATRLGSLGMSVRSMTDIRSALEEVLRTVRTLLGATSAVLMLYDPERDELFPRAGLDVPQDYLTLLTPVTRPVGARGTGLATVEPLVMEDVRLSPLMEPYAGGAEAAGIRAIYSTPLLTLGDELMGTISAFFPSPHRPSGREVQLVGAYARQTAEMIERARMHGEARELVKRERAAREEAERNAQLRGLLADASQAFAASLELDATLATVSDLTVPVLADWISVHLLGETGQAELAYVHHHDADRERELRETLQGSTEVPAGVGAQIVVPLRARGRTFGALSLVREEGSPYASSDYLLARELADRAALAVDNAARFAFEREMAATLQHSLLPQDLPLTPVIDAASRYLPGASGTRIGGDWYDVVLLDDGRVAMVVGDVMGRGVTAAVVMGQLRAAVRAYAIEGHSPAVLLARLDQVVQALGHSQLTTCLYAVYDPDARTLTVGAAGHLPPLLVPPEGEPWYLQLEPGLPLGVGGATYAETTVEVAPGTILVLYTDGLVEGPATPIDEGLETLRRAVPRHAPSLDDLCDQVLHALGRDGDHDDDTALLAVAFTGAPRGSAVTSPVLELAPTPESASMARRFVGERIGSVVEPELAATAELLVSELVTNAVRHARSTLAVRLTTLPHAVRIDVTDESAAPPVPRDEIDEEAEDGRGMLLVEALSERWGYERLLSGKRVWFELARP